MNYTIIAAGCGISEFQKAFLEKDIDSFTKLYFKSLRLNISEKTHEIIIMLAEMDEKNLPDIIS